MSYLRYTLLLVVVSSSSVAAQQDSGIDPEALIERMLAVDRQQSEQLKDVVFDAEYIEGEDKGDEGFKEEVRFVKKVSIKYFEDTAWYHEEYLEYYKDGELKSEKDLLKQAAERKEKKRKRKTRDISYSMLKPFYPEQRELYNLEYLGVSSERIEEHVCHHFRVDALEEIDSLIRGDFYFEAETFHLVQADFSPAKLVKKTMFKLKELNMSITYAPSDENIWLPTRFDFAGKGKAALFFGVDFSGTEYYSNPVVNGGIETSVFEGEHDE